MNDNEKFIKGKIDYLPFLIVILENRITMRAIVNISMASKNVVVAHDLLFSLDLITSNSSKYAS